MIIYLPDHIWHNTDSLVQDETHMADRDGLPVSAMDFHPSGRLATASSDGSINIWQIRYAHLSKCVHVDYLARLTNHTMEINTLKFSPNGHMLLSVSDDRHIALYSYERLKNELDNDDNDEIWTCKKTWSDNNEVFDVDWHPSNMGFTTGNANGQLHTYFFTTDLSSIPMTAQNPNIYYSKEQSDGKDSVSRSTEMSLEEAHTLHSLIPHLTHILSSLSYEEYATLTGVPVANGSGHIVAGAVGRVLSASVSECIQDPGNQVEDSFTSSNNNSSNNTGIDVQKGDNSQTEKTNSDNKTDNKTSQPSSSSSSSSNSSSSSSSNSSSSSSSSSSSNSSSSSSSSSSSNSSSSSSSSSSSNSSSDPSSDPSSHALSDILTTPSDLATPAPSSTTDSTDSESTKTITIDIQTDSIVSPHLTHSPLLPSPLSYVHILPDKTTGFSSPLPIAVPVDTSRIVHRSRILVNQDGREYSRVKGVAWDPLGMYCVSLNADRNMQVHSCMRSHQVRRLRDSTPTQLTLLHNLTHVSLKHSDSYTDVNEDVQKDTQKDVQMADSDSITDTSMTDTIEDEGVCVNTQSSQVVPTQIGDGASSQDVGEGAQTNMDDKVENTDNLNLDGSNSLQNSLQNAVNDSDSMNDLDETSSATISTSTTKSTSTSTSTSSTSSTSKSQWSFLPETSSAFIRRLSWSPDGALLAVPTGYNTKHCKPPSTTSEPDATQETESTAGQSSEEVKDSTSSDSLSDKSERPQPSSSPIDTPPPRPSDFQYCTYIFTRDDLTRPALVLPSDEPVLITCFSPVPLQTPLFSPVLTHLSHLHSQTAPHSNSASSVSSTNPSTNSSQLSQSGKTPNLSESVDPNADDGLSSIPVPSYPTVTGTGYCYYLAVATTCSTMVYRTDDFSLVLVARNVLKLPLTDLAWSACGRLLSVASRHFYLAFIDMLNHSDLNPTKKTDKTDKNKDKSMENPQSGLYLPLSGDALRAYHYGLKQLKYFTRLDSFLPAFSNVTGDDNPDDSSNLPYVYEKLVSFGVDMYSATEKLTRLSLFGHYRPLPLPEPVKPAKSNKNKTNTSLETSKTTSLTQPGSTEETNEPIITTGEDETNSTLNSDNPSEPPSTDNTTTLPNESLSETSVKSDKKPDQVKEKEITDFIVNYYEQSQTFPLQKSILIEFKNYFSKSKIRNIWLNAHEVVGLPKPQPKSKNDQKKTDTPTTSST